MYRGIYNNIRGLMVFLAGGLLLGTCPGVTGATIYSETVIGDDPVAYWRLGETSGTTAADEQGSFPGTYEVTDGETPISLGDAGPQTSDGFPGMGTENLAPTFPGGNNGTTVATEVSSSDYGGDYPFTVEAWFRTDVDAKAQNILTLSDENAGEKLWGIGLRRAEDNSGSTVRAYAYNGQFFDVRTPDGGPGSSGGTDVIFNDGDWHYVAGVFRPDTDNEDGDGSTDYQISLYVDPTAPTPVSTGFHNRTFVDSVDGTNIGSLIRNNGDIQSEFDGQIDEAAVYNSALTGEQVLAHYRAATTPEPSLTALLAVGLLAGLACRRPK